MAGALYRHTAKEYFGKNNLEENKKKSKIFKVSATFDKISKCNRKSGF